MLTRASERTRCPRTCILRSMGIETATNPHEVDAEGRPLGPQREIEGLPPGPRLPSALQTARLMARPVPFLEDCRRRFGDTFTARVLRVGPLVFISDPSSLKRLFGDDRDNTLSPRETPSSHRFWGSGRCSFWRATSTCAAAG